MPTPYDATRCDARITLMLTPSPSNPRRGLAGLMRQPFLLAAFVLFWFHMAHAETVAIANMDISREAILREAALKRFLREDGYTVKGASPEGFIVLLHGMSAQTRRECRRGRLCHGRQGVAARIHSCPAARWLPTGTGVPRDIQCSHRWPLIYLAGTTASGGDAEEVPRSSVSM